MSTILNPGRVEKVANFTVTKQATVTFKINTKDSSLVVNLANAFFDSQSKLGPPIGKDDFGLITINVNNTI